MALQTCLTIFFIVFGGGFRGASDVNSLNGR